MPNSDMDDSIMHKALLVSKIPDDFDPKKTPENGEQYLQFVRYEAQKCQQYLKAEISPEKTKTIELFINEPKSIDSAPDDHKPSVLWQRQKTADFSALRIHLQRVKQSKNVPQTVFNGEINQWRKKCFVGPKLSEILSLSQKSIFKILNFCVIWLSDVPKGSTIDHCLGAWLYALLCCLETPLMPEYCYTLREIARKCATIRLGLPENCNNDLYVPLNLFICIIAKYFNNYDLIDEINEI